MKKILIALLIVLFVPAPAEALTRHEIEMFKKLQSKWKKKSAGLYRARNKLKGSDPRYTGLTKQIIKANYKAKYYTEAQIDRSTFWHVIKNTFVWSAQDLAETGAIMWNTSEGMLQNLYEGNWTEVLKSTTDSLMRQKVRKLIRGRFGGKEYRQIEDHIMDKFIMPKLNKSKLDGYAEEAFGKAKEKLQDAYVEEVKRQAASRSKDELKRVGKNIAERVSGAVSAAEFTFDMVAKYVMWSDAQRTIETMLGHIQKIQKREKCSTVKAFNIYLGKEKMTAKEPAKKQAASKPDKAPLAFHPHYVDPMSVDKTPPTLKGALSEVVGSGKRKRFRSPNQCYDAFIKPDGLPTGSAILYYGCTRTVKHVTSSLTSGFKATHFHKNGKAYLEESKTDHPGPKLDDVRRAWGEAGAITHWMKYKRGELMTEIRFSFGGKPVTAYFYEGGKKTGSIRYSYAGAGGKLIEVHHMYKGKSLKWEKY